LIRPIAVALERKAEVDATAQGLQKALPEVCRCFNRFQMKWPVWRWSLWIVWPLQGPEPQQDYGLTETWGPYTVCEIQEGWTRLDPQARNRMMAHQGVGMLVTDGVRVVAKDMTDIPRDGATMGEVVMRGNNVMSGYFNDPEATEKAFRGGWFHSGDLGVWHPDGYIELRDRAKDIIVSGGENISTIEVEAAIVSHPAVLEVAVVGVPHEKWGERPKAFVVLRSGATATAEEIIGHVCGQIARYKVPDYVDFVADLPKTATGKIQKFQLREREWQGRESRVQG